jgi:tetratricopeptide (TPR) repeat protein
VGVHYLGADDHYRLAQDALQRRDYARARAHLALALEARPTSAELALLLARIERRAGNCEEARQQLNRCQELQGPTEAIELEGLLLRVQQGEVGGPEYALWERLERDDPDTELILEALAQGYMKAYRAREALTCLMRLLDRQPEHAQAQFWRGQVYQRLGRMPNAAADYRQAVALNPEDDLARVCLGEVLLYLIQPEQAAEQFEYLVERLPENPAVQLGLARCRRGQGRLEEAEQILKVLSTLHPDEGQIWTDRGQVALDAERIADAESHLRQAVSMRPFDHQTVYALLQCLERRGRKDEANTWRQRLDQIEQDRKRLAQLTKELFYNPLVPAQCCEAGQLSLRLGQDEMARGWFESALRQDPRCKAALAGLAEYYEHVGNPAAAARYRQRVAALATARKDKGSQ